MDSNASGFLFNNGMIDLGLRLRTLQPETYPPSAQMNQVLSLDGYGELMDWPQSGASEIKKSSNGYNKLFQGECDEEGDGAQSGERWAYVKVNMDGIMVGRKVCIPDQGSYSALARQLEDMFGMQSVSGLRLLHAGSDFSLFYKGRDEDWRLVGDVPWKEFVESVTRLRIARRNNAFHAFSPSFN